MSPRAEAPVTTRMLQPEPSGVDNVLLYRPVPQLTGAVTMKPRFVKVTPKMAKDWVAKSEEDDTFRQRVTKVRDVRRWQILMQTDRFVSYLPNGPLCFDENGILLNGKHRLTALAGQDDAFGFLVIDKVPRWMFPFFDTGAPRTLNDVFHISSRASKAQTGSTMRLAMRYEEFLHGKRPGTGWKEWFSQRDEHADVDSFLARREDLNDWYYLGQQIYTACKLNIGAVTVFRYYQSLAWPDGEEQLAEFCNGLAKGAMLAPGKPALVLREWSRASFEQRDRIRGKRELHLLLLFRMFARTLQGDGMGRLQWAYGFPMTMPYHPNGHDAAVKNILTALNEVDADHGRV